MRARHLEMVSKPLILNKYKKFTSFQAGALRDHTV
jgi:hypothetical protein